MDRTTIALVCAGGALAVEAAINALADEVDDQRERADLAEAEVELLRAIEHIGRRRIGKNITRPDVYHVAGQDTNHRLCLALIALDEWRAALEPKP